MPKRASPNQSNMTPQSSFMTSQTSFIATPLRATMPGRILSVDKHNKLSCDSVNQSGTMVSDNHSASTTESPPTCGQKVTSPSAKYEPDVRRLQSDDSVFTDAPTSPPVMNGDSPALTADRSYCYTVSNEFSTSTLTGDHSSSPVRVAARGRSKGDAHGVECEGEVKIKRMIEKEYVHVQDVSFFEALKKKSDSLSRVIGDGSPPGDTDHRDKKRNRSPFRWSKKRNNSGTGVNTNNNVGNSEPNSPARVGSKLYSDDILPPGGRAVRSTTLPSEILTGGGVGSPSSVKKSSKKKSKSITSFFQVSYTIIRAGSK